MNRLWRARSRPSAPERPTFKVAAFRRRDRAALAQFFELYFDRVYDLLFRLVANEAVAEDLAQEVMVKVQRSASSLDPTRDPWRWLVTIAINTCRDHWDAEAVRQRGRHRELFEDEGDALAAPREADDPSALSITREEARLVQESIREMPSPMRAVVVLRDYEGLSHEEIADTLGVSAVAARKQYSRGLALLGQLLKERGV